MQHCYSVTDSPTGTYQSMHMDQPLQWFDTGLSSAANPAHYTSEEWIDGSDGSYIEAGIYQGWVPPNNSVSNGGTTWTYETAAANEAPGCAANGCTGYIFIWGDTVKSGRTSVQRDHIVHFLSPNPGVRYGFDIGYIGLVSNQRTWGIHIYAMSGPAYDYQGRSFATGMYQAEAMSAPSYIKAEESQAVRTLLT